MPAAYRLTALQPHLCLWLQHYHIGALKGATIGGAQELMAQQTRA